MVWFYRRLLPKRRDNLGPKELSMMVAKRWKTRSVHTKKSMEKESYFRVYS